MTTPSSGNSRSQRNRIANEQRLAALGEAIDQRSGRTPRPAPRGGRGGGRRGGRRTRRRITISLIVVGALLLGVAGGGYLYAQWKFGKITKIHNKAEQPLRGPAFNIMVLGSDSGNGLTPTERAKTGRNSVSGARSDVVKIVHVNPNAGTISMISIPRDTVVTMMANQNLYGNFNRINAAFNNGPALVARTITANFGIPINYTVVVSFAGMINIATAVGGVYLNFPHLARDPYSQLNITHTGCQLVTGFQALALVRSRHYYWQHSGNVPWPHGGNLWALNTLNRTGWWSDGSSDFGRIERQNAFLRALVNKLKGQTSVFKLNSVLSALPQGLAIDAKMSLSWLVRLGLRFKGIGANSIATYTMPVHGKIIGGADMEVVTQPKAQQLLVNIFGNELARPTNPAPNDALQSVQPPVIYATTTTISHATTTVKHHKLHKPVATTTTTSPTSVALAGNPTPCTPKF